MYRRLALTIQSAEQGDAVAQFNLGVVYYYQRGGVKGDKQKAEKWYQKSALQGSGMARYGIDGITRLLGKV